MLPQPTVRVLVVDDSVFMRTVLCDALSRVDGISVLGAAANGSEGLERILAEKPDVVTLDVEMPGLSGLEVLDRVMKQRPTPIVVVSTKTQSGAETTLAALERGAVECVPKPLGDKNSRLESFRARVVEAVLAAAQSNRCSLARRVRLPAPGERELDAPADAVIAIGISAGGPQTLHQMMPVFPRDFPPIVITQHMPPGFTRAFAERLNAECRLAVREAQDDEVLCPGVALIAPGDRHLRVVARRGVLRVALGNGPKVSGFRPSVDAMFESLATACPRRSVAIVMTGMGVDGAEAIRLLRAAGARTLAQDRATSVVYGMPKAAFETGCVERVCALREIPRALAASARELLAGAAVGR